MKGTIACLVLLAGASTAWAGTKYLTNLASPNDAPPLLAADSKLFFTDRGLAKVLLKGVRAANGSLVTTKKPNASGTLYGDEYVAVMHGRILSLDVAFELNAVVALKKGKGKAKLDTSGLFALLPKPLAQTIGVEGVEVFGPLGATSAACQHNLTTSAGISFPPAPNPCVGGDLIGQSGIIVP
jgi:hypothetical protein